tara:strand:+ start:122 stop:331 length:210 start_codon:yes stop_codon:yes gene_type:complete
MKLIFNIMAATSFGLSLLLIGVIIFLNATKQSRIEENRNYMKKIIEEEVSKQIPRSLPRVTGEVYVPDK